MIFTAEQIRRMVAHAESAYPRECIGVLTGLWENPEAIALNKLTNKLDELFRQDPERYQRDARTGYFVDPKEVFNLVTHTQREGNKILAFYHSHPDHESYFSREDLAAAVMWGEPVYPDAVYIVLSVFGGKAKEAKVFAWNGVGYAPAATLAIE